MTTTAHSNTSLCLITGIVRSSASRKRIRIFNSFCDSTYTAARLAQALRAFTSFFTGKPKRPYLQAKGLDIRFVHLDTPVRGIELNASINPLFRASASNRRHRVQQKKRDRSLFRYQGGNSLTHRDGSQALRWRLLRPGNRFGLLLSKKRSSVQLIVDQ